MLFTLIVSFAAGYILGSIIAYCIDVVDEWLTSQRAKELASEKTGKKITKLVIDKVQKNAEYGETISVRAFDESYEHFADITFNAEKGSSLYTNQTIY